MPWVEIRKDAWCVFLFCLFVSSVLLETELVVMSAAGAHFLVYEDRWSEKKQSACYTFFVVFRLYSGTFGASEARLVVVLDV